MTRGGYQGRGRGGGGGGSQGFQPYPSEYSGRGNGNGYAAAAPIPPQGQQYQTQGYQAQQGSYQQQAYQAPGTGRGGGRGGGRGQQQQAQQSQYTAPAQQQYQQQQPHHAPQQQQQQQQSYQHTAPPKANPNSRTTSTTRSQMTTDRFDSLNVSHNIKNSMATVLCYEFMTRVQSMTIPVSLSGSDMLAKAKTGTGKTLAFLIPTLDTVERIPYPQRKGFTSILIISPTRELAQQIADEGSQVLQNMSLRSMVVFGGTPIRSDVSAFRRAQPDLLVATPGRLNDLLQNHGQQAFMARLRCLVFDEADQLLEMGFRPEITKMLGMLPSKETRQTLLFSATMPDDVMHIARFALRSSFEHIDCVGEDADTHHHVDQSYCVHPMANQFAELLNVLQEGMRIDPDYKILVFFTTAKLTQMASELFNGMGVPVLEMHSRKTQPQRTATSNKFREGNRVIMFTSDVTARGMDYPDVSRVVQVGLPADKAQYTHRLGRTARAGKEGDGVLLLCDFEKSFLNSMKDQKMDMRKPLTPDMLAPMQTHLNTALRKMSRGTLASAYQAWLGFYNSNLKKLGWTKVRCVEEANRWITECCLMQEIPALLPKTVGKMNLQDVPGLRIERGGGGGGGGGKGGGKGGGGKGGGKGGKGGGRW